jgi:hypothetical protein
MESHLLRSRQGGFTLGVKVPKGKTLEFIPGHCIRTSSGTSGCCQITDGMVGYWEKGVFNIFGIFEGKSGRNGARELSIKSKSAAGLSQKDLEELRAFAKDVWAEQKDAAGNTFTTTIERVEKDVNPFLLVKMPAII